MIQESVCCNT